MTDQQQRRVVLIFGDPDHGKSHLAAQLHTSYGYYSVSLDEVYVEFIKNQYPELFLPALRHLIGQHYNVMFAQDPGRVGVWHEHVVSIVRAAVTQHKLVSVEGYLLAPPVGAPALAPVQASLTDLATVTTVEVRNRQYFTASSIEQIHG